MTLWNPSFISTALWLDAADGSSITSDANGISQWNDKSGNTRHATQGVNANKPTYTATLNSLSVATLDGGNDFLALTTGVDITADMVVLSVLGRTGPGLKTFPLGGAGSYPYAHFWYSDNVLYDSLGNGSTTHGGASTATGSFVMTSKRTSSADFINRNGTKVGTDQTPPAIGTNKLLYVGRRNTDYHSGVIAEIVVCNSAADYQKIEGYLAWKWGLQGSLPTDHPYKTAAPTILSAFLRQVVSQPYLMEGSVRCPLDQLYGLTVRRAAVLSQMYGLRLLVALSQRYGDVPAFRRLLDQYWGSAAILRRTCAERYGDALALRQTIDQEWTLRGLLRRAMEQGYSISGEALRSLLIEQYDISEYNLLRQQLDQLWILPPGDELLQKPVIAVTADGVAIDPYHITIDTLASDYAIRGEIHLDDETDFLRCRHLQTVLAITVDATTYLALADSPRRSRPETGRTEYYVPFVSRSVLLDAPSAATLSREFAGAMASAIVAEMAATAGIAIDWQLVDWYLPAATLYANNETPLAIIRKIVEAVGGILQTAPDGTLICRPEYPVPVNKWETASPDFYLTDMDNFFSVDSTPEIRDGYNRFLLSDQDVATAGLTLEQKDIDATTKEVMVYQVPWDGGADIILRTSGGSWVSIVAEGIVAEQLTELVEIVAGEGRTTKPIYTMDAHTYKQALLGAITPADDGHIATELGGNSLLEVVYTTRYRKFRCSDARIEDVQFYPEVVPI